MTTKQIDTPLYDTIANKFEITSLRGNQDHLNDIRKKAFSIFESEKLPSIKNEEWRFANVMPYLKKEYKWEIEKTEFTQAELAKISERINTHLASIKSAHKEVVEDNYLIVNINGQWCKELSHLPSSDDLTVVQISEANDLPSFQKHFGKVAVMEKNGFVALNTALFVDGLFIEAPKNKKIDKPLHFVNVYLSDSNLWVQPRNLVVLNPFAELEIIETVLEDDHNSEIFINGVTEVALAENAHFYHYDLQTGREGMRFVQRIEASQMKHSNYSNYTFTLPGSDFVRNNLAIHLEEPELVSHMYGLYIGADSQLIDNHTEVHHKKPRGNSNQLYKGVLLDKAKAVFNGKIFVYEDAQLTDAFQQSNNILFSDKATVNAKPQLEIFADDVKCSHGMTIGQLDKEAMFYLQSRGISEESARNIMVNAFVFDVSQKVENAALRSYLEQRINEIMNQATPVF